MPKRQKTYNQVDVNHTTSLGKWMEAIDRMQRATENNTNRYGRYIEALETLNENDIRNVIKVVCG